MFVKELETMLQFVVLDIVGATHTSSSFCKKHFFFKVVQNANCEDVSSVGSIP